MKGQRTLAIASLAIFPVALVFIVARSLLAGDLRELIAAPFSAFMITAVGYPIAFAVGAVLLRIHPSLKQAKLGTAIAIGFVSAEASFWLVIHPLWQREFSDSFCAALVAGCGIAVATTFRVLRPNSSAN